VTLATGYITVLSLVHTDDYSRRSRRRRRPKRRQFVGNGDYSRQCGRGVSRNYESYIYSDYFPMTAIAWPTKVKADMRI